jgi:hypothetical protein
MSAFRTTLLSLSLCLSNWLAGPIYAVSAQAADVKFPALISARSTNVSPGKATLPFIVSLARHPELLQPPYLRLVFGMPDRARLYAYPSNTFTWTPDDGSGTHFVLSRRLDQRVPAGGETRQLVTTFKRAAMPLKSVRSCLGKPIRRYFDNQSQPVELFQLSPNSTLAVCEPTNTFDVSQMTICYSGPYLPQVSADDMLKASSFRLTQIDHHLARGNSERGMSLLQEYVGDNPQDIKAHLLLADALRRKCNVNASIAEYRRALALAQGCGDVSLQKQAMKGLTPMGLVPKDAPVVRALSLKDAAQGGSIPQ